MNEPILGWDVGGVNLKAVRVWGNGEASLSESAVVQRAFPLWREPHRLNPVLVEMADSLGGVDAIGDMAITMTAELADCFPTKRDGVVFVLDAFREAFPDIEPRVFGLDGRFRSSAEAREEPLQVGAANWMAGAMFVAEAFPDSIFIDVGSTTADIIPIRGGHVAAVGRTDAERLSTGELVYTGALRTPVCAIVGTVPLSGRQCRVAAEHFAVAADVHLWLSRIEESDYTCETPDGRGRSRPEAGARLARMVCADFEMLDEDDITAIAEHVAQAQQQQIAEGVSEVIRHLGRDAPNTAVLAGGGTFLARAALEQSRLKMCDLADHIGVGAARAAPAAAVAYLLAASRTGEGEAFGLEPLKNRMV